MDSTELKPTSKIPEGATFKSQPAAPLVEEISLESILKFLRKNFLVILIAVVLFGAIGYGVTRLMPVEYSATAKILPEAAGNNMGGLGGLASMAGISLARSQDGISPDLYPDLVQSRTCLIKILTTPLSAQDNKTVVLMEYLGKNVPSLTPAQIAQADSMLVLTKDQELVMRTMAGRIEVTMDRLTGILTLEVEMPDPVLAASSTKFIINYLTTFVSEYQSGRETQKVVFLNQQVLAAKQKYQRAELALNAYRDRNRNPFTNVSQIEEQRLQSDFTQQQSLYAELTRQLESARLQALEESPVLKIIEPPMVPNQSSSPKTLVFIIASALFGLVLVILFLLLRNSS
jgi:uncharacterized protein involved in exopolysaccharide biosynthesis